MDAGPDIEVVRRYAEAQGADAFGGITGAPNDPEAILVGFTDDIERHQLELTRRMADPTRLRLFRAEYPLRHLESIRERLDDEADSYDFDRDGLVVASTDLDIAASRIVWNVFAREPDGAVELLRERHGKALHVRVLGRSPWAREKVPCDAFSELEEGRRLRLYYRVLPPAELATVQVDETPDRVAVALEVSTWLGDTKLVPHERHADTDLAAVLGEMAVVDLVSGRQLGPRGE